MGLTNKKTHEPELAHALLKLIFLNFVEPLFK